ncbi:MAG: glycosyltransferase family 9 protein [Bdellovibrionaceae bacterium]|nr:glycosyltransferase family 9 protein [Pseudobdellovibrionaceae bacterium]
MASVLPRLSDNETICRMQDAETQTMTAAPTGKRVLFVKLGAIGDVIMALPLSRSLARQGVEVTWVCGQSLEPLVRTFSDAQIIETINDRKLFAGNLTAKLTVFVQVFLRFLGRRYDEVLIGHADPRYRLLFKGVRGPVFSFGSHLGGNRIPTGTRHHSYEYLKLATREDSSMAPDPKQFMPRPLKVWKGQGSKVIAFAPGGARNLLADDRLRRWPITHYRKLAEELLANGFDVQIFGAPTDAWVMQSFQGLNVKNRIGELDLLGFVGALSEVEALVTHDSGPLHIGGLAGVPVFGLFGPTEGSWRFPIGNRGRILQLAEKLPCQPCYDGKNFAPCSDNRCLSAISPHRVFEEIQQTLART